MFYGHKQLGQNLIKKIEIPYGGGGRYLNSVFKTYRLNGLGTVKEVWFLFYAHEIHV
jgi:hypothetical protein